MSPALQAVVCEAILRVGGWGRSCQDVGVLHRDCPMRPLATEPSPMIAALDLGSNSFHMVLARTSNGEMRIIERLGEKVQLAAGIDENRMLDDAAMQRGLDCLRRFAQLVNHLPQGAVRIVGTNALREARNRAAFIRR